MERYTKEQLILIIKTFYQNSESLAATVRKLRSNWGIHNNNKQKLSESGSVINVKRLTRVCTGRSN